MEACVFSTATNLNLQNEHVFNAMVTELLTTFPNQHHNDKWCTKENQKQRVQDALVDIKQVPFDNVLTST